MGGAAGSILGGGVGLGKDIFGTAQNQNTVGGQTAYTKFDPSQLEVAHGARANVMNALTDLQNQGGQAATAFNNAKTNLNTNFGNVGLNVPQFGQELDSISQGLVSQERGAHAAQLGQQQRGIAQQFGSQNPIVAHILQQQAAAQSQLSNNPLAFAARQAQGGRIANEAGAQNQAILGQSQQNMALQQAGNAAQTQQQQNDFSRIQQVLGAQGLSAGAAQNLLSTLLGFAQATGQQKSDAGNQSSGRSGGLF